MVTVGLSLDLEESLSGSCFVELLDALLAHWNVRHLVVSLLSPFDPLPILGALDSLDRPVRSILALTKVQLPLAVFLEPKRFDDMPNSSSSSQDAQRVNTI